MAEFNQRTHKFITKKSATYNKINWMDILKWNVINCKFTFNDKYCIFDSTYLMHNCRPMKYLTRIRFLNQLYMHCHPDCKRFYLENFRHLNKIMETHRLNRIPIFGCDKTNDYFILWPVNRTHGFVWKNRYPNQSRDKYTATSSSSSAAAAPANSSNTNEMKKRTKKKQFFNGKWL